MSVMDPTVKVSGKKNLKKSNHANGTGPLQADAPAAPPVPKSAGRYAQVNKGGMTFKRYYTHAGVHPFDELTYEYRTSKITEPDGTIIFEMNNVEVPSTWSQLATDILVSKYFRKAGVPETGHETSVKQVVHRLAHTIRVQGDHFGLFASKEDADKIGRASCRERVCQYV